MTDGKWTPPEEIAAYLEATVPNVGRIRVFGMRCDLCDEVIEMPGYEGQSFTVSASRFRAILQFQHHDDCEGHALVESEPVR